jgi:hypothetical protein
MNQIIKGYFFICPRPFTTTRPHACYSGTFSMLAINQYLNPL